MGGKECGSQRPQARAQKQLTSSEEERGDRGTPKISMTLPNPGESANPKGKKKKGERSRPEAVAREREAEGYTGRVRERERRA